MSNSKVSKILIVHPVLTPGGATKVAISDAVSLRSQGLAVGFATGRTALEKELEAKTIRQHRLYFVDSTRYPKWFRYLVGLPLSTILLLYFVWREKYDCLYVHHRQSGLPSTVVSWLTGAKYVFICHTELGKLNRGRLLTPLGHHIIAVSEQVKRNISTHFRVPSCTITVIPNATKAEVVRTEERSLRAFEKEWSIPPESDVVACVAMLVEVKAHNVLLSAWKQVMDHFPQAVLILAGDGPLRECLQKQCAELGIAQWVRFMGFVDDVSIVYSRARLVVLPSRSEALPTCLLEAFSYGLPAVATAVSGIPEIVIPQRTGLLVEPENPEQLAQGIICLLSDPQLQRQLGENGRQLVISKYSSPARALALSKYFRSLE